VYIFVKSRHIFNGQRPVCKYACCMSLNIDWLDIKFFWHLIFMNCLAFMQLHTYISLKNHNVGVRKVKNYWNNMYVKRYHLLIKFRTYVNIGYLCLSILSVLLQVVFMTVYYLWLLMISLDLYNLGICILLKAIKTSSFLFYIAQ